MDSHLLIKIIHMSCVLLFIVVFVLRGVTLFIGTNNQQPNTKARVLFVALQHLMLTLLAVTGLTLLVMNDFKVQPWFYAKIVLFLVLFSSLIKVYRKDQAIQLSQRRAGLFISAVALIAILGLVMIKPVFG